MLENQMEKEFTCPELSTFVLTRDKKYCCIGTKENNAKLYFW